MKISHLFLCTLLFICYSCGSDDTPEPTPTLTVGLMTATVEGTVIKSTLGTSDIQELTTTTGKQYRMTGATGINPFSAGFLNISFFLPLEDDLEARTYSFVDSECSTSEPVTEVCGRTNLSATALELDEGYFSDCVGCSLNITISEVDFRVGGRVQGTFTGMVKSIASDEIVPLTDGEFLVEITE